MALTARTKDGQTVLALNYENSAELYQHHPKETLISPYPDCNTPVHARFRPGAVPHFVHQSGEVVRTKYEHHPYSTEHELAKLMLGRYFQSQLKEEIAFEVPIENRIVDILCGPNDSRLAIEVQLSPITTESLSQRTKDILKGGADVVWALGGKADTEANRQWCIKNTGSVMLIGFESTRQAIGVRETEQLIRDFRTVALRSTRRNVA